MNLYKPFSSSEGRVSFSSLPKQSLLSQSLRSNTLASAAFAPSLSSTLFSSTSYCIVITYGPRPGFFLIHLSLHLPFQSNPNFERNTSDKMQLPTSTLLALLPFFLRSVSAGASGTGTTTRYWDCCKPSCAWPGKASLLSGSNPVTTCDISNNPLTDYNTASGCNGGGAYQCSNESPWAVNDNLAYGYAAVNIAGGTESSWCCACYELTFTSGAVAGKKMIVQATNTGGDLAGNQFDISVSQALLFPDP